MRWKDTAAAAPPLPLFTAQYPHVADRLAKSGGEKTRFWFVLEEDRFDTLLGDKLFQYFQGAVFDSEEAAGAYAGRLNEEAKEAEAQGEFGVLYIVKDFEACLDGNIIIPSGHEPGPSQDYYIEKILGRIEETLASRGKLEWGTRFPGW